MDYTYPCSEAKIMNIVTNGWEQHYDTIGIFKSLPVEDHYNSKSPDKILSLNDVASLSGVRIKMDTSVERAIVVTLQGGICMNFKEWNDGLYYFDTKNDKLEDSHVVIPI